MAWVLHEKAVAHGEMTRDQANAAMADFYRRDIVEEPESCEKPVPEALRRLLDASGALYRRVLRLRPA